jgi:hypothetical protein
MSVTHARDFEHDNRTSLRRTTNIDTIRQIVTYSDLEHFRCSDERDLVFSADVLEDSTT